MRTTRGKHKLVVVALFILLGLGILYTSKAEGKENRGANRQDGTALAMTAGGETDQSLAQQNPSLTFPTSLHATRRGKATWYSADNGGFEGLTGIPIEQLNCQKCHPTIPPTQYQPSCTDCHKTAIGDLVADQTCLGCHSRQGLEIRLGYSDVHRDAGFQCRDCHTTREMHGDGMEYTSWLQPGAMDVKCENCHTQVATQNTAHIIHFSTVDCNACHTQSVIACYNCHFESEVSGNRKRWNVVMKDFMFLLRREGSGKVFPGSFQSVSYQGQTFYAVGPYRAHTIARNARTCDDCHNSPALQEYLQTGKMTVGQWDGSQIVSATGVIPLPPDWQQALQLDFLTYTGDVSSPQTDPTKWVFLKSGADNQQMLFAQPLTAEQINKLRTYGR